ncbi:MAG: sensor domain-containing diguanylate cyclase [Sphaerochaetaceae bacterium]|jgi:diguanylate cyclase (GGDEF)-like protein/PAS domain S-box-containing protein|nr:sensor domain-containing diguanylate cyclase [Sphaerochaetaceae bacterium]MDX9933369.1 sensor domain-containing diguanylate cyclase [Sphaerochaetaceae bacterium]NLO60235.1 sensor domain-containing diguanylate cyclase [Spirochaetales bacterium]
MNRHRIGLLIVILLGLLLIVSADWIFVGNHLNIHRRDESRMLLTESIQDVRVIDTKIQSSFYYLESLASLITSGAELPLDTIAVSSDRNRLAFKYLSLVDMKGTVIRGDELPIDPRSLEYFGTGTIALSPLPEQEALVLMVPIRPKIAVEATLIGIYDFETIIKLFTETSSAIHNKIYFTYNDGELFYPEVFPEGNSNLFKYLEQVRFIDTDSTTIKSNFSQLKPSVAEFRYQGTNYFITSTMVPSTEYFLVQIFPVSELLVYQSINTLRWIIIIFSIVLTVVIIALTAVYLRLRFFSRRYRERKDRLPETVPGGDFSYFISDNYNFIDVSDSFVSLLGYQTKKELLDSCASRFDNLIYELDKDTMFQTRASQHIGPPAALLHYRVITKSKTILWLADWSHITISAKGQKVVQSIVIDVTATKSIEEDRRVSEERFRIIQSQAKSVVFEWNINENYFYRSPNWSEVFGYSPKDNSVEHIFKLERFHQDDRNAVLDLLQQSKKGFDKGSINVRFRNGNNQYRWVDISFASLFDEHGNQTKVLGRMVDIDDQKRQEILLKQKALTDPLTSLFHKLAIEDEVNNYLEQYGKNAKHAACLIDLDHFKLINDQYGHSAGDAILINFAKKINELLQSFGFIPGRVGGDEFFILVKNLYDQKDIREVAKLLVDGLRSQINCSGQEVNVSVSIGIVRYPEDGVTYRQLFDVADKALYYVKNHGRNGFHIFDPDTDEYLTNTTIS